MNSSTILHCLAFVFVLLIAPVHAQSQDAESEAEVVEIPLDQIWAWQMPGTKDIRELDERRSSGLLKEIGRVLSIRPPEGEQPRLGFAVRGTGMEALRGAHAVLVKGEKPEATFQLDNDVSVVFFSYQAGVYVHLHEVEHADGLVRVTYRLVPHRTREATAHFALIPLGKVTEGTVRIDVGQSPLESKLANAFRVPPLRPELGCQIVCKSFSFKVIDARDN